MTARAYYNEHDAFCAQWLGNLIAAGHIMAGDVDERDIRDVQPDDVRGYTRCHFFGGIAGWDLALRLAGWPEDREVWTGSCPCQPFSSAGAQQGTDDSRHLWPTWFRLIRECRPPVVLGEQVASAIGHGWLDLVFDDLEGEGYACGAAVLPACSVGAPHLRQRLWFVAESESVRQRQSQYTRAMVGTTTPQSQHESSVLSNRLVGRLATGELADAGGDECGSGRRRTPLEGRAESAGSAEQPSRLCDGDSVGELADAMCERGQQDARGAPTDEAPDGRAGRDGGEPNSNHVAASDGKNFWRPCDWLPCRDGRQRPTQPGLFPLVAGLPKGMGRGGGVGTSFDPDATAEGRIGRLRGYGNSIVAPLAAEFLRAVMKEVA